MLAAPKGAGMTCWRLQTGVLAPEMVSWDTHHLFRHIFIFQSEEGGITVWCRLTVAG